MSDSDGSPQRNDRHHRPSRYRFPVSLGFAGETPAEREERRLAEAAVLVGPPSGQPQAARASLEPAAQEPVPAGEATPATQAAGPAAPPPEEAPGAQGAETAGPASDATAPAGHTAAPSKPPAHGTGPARAPSASPGAAAAAAGGREGAKYRAHAEPSHTRTRPPKPYLPKAAFPKGRPRPVRPQAPTRTPPGITLPQLQRQRDARRVIQEGWDGARAGQGTSHGSMERGAGGDRESAQGQTHRPGRKRQGERTRTQARHQGQRQRGRTGTRGRPEGEQRTAGRSTQRRERTRAQKGHGREQQRPETDART